MVVLIAAAAVIGLVPGHAPDHGRSAAGLSPAKLQANFNTQSSPITDGSLIWAYTSLDVFCNAGWWAVNPAGANFLLTAGSCLQAAQSSPAWYSGDDDSDVIGSSANWNYGGSSASGTASDQADWGAIAFTNSVFRPTTQVGLTGTQQIDDVTGPWPYTPVGDTVCFYANDGGQQCGPIISYDASVTTSDGTSLAGMVEAGFCPQGHDKGAPVYQDDPMNRGYVIPQGILSSSVTDSGGCVSYYTPINTALGDANLTIVSSVGAPTVQGGFKFGDSVGCLDSNAQGSVYVHGCNAGQYQDWELPGWPSGSQASGQLQDVATGLCLAADSAGDVFTGPCDGSGTQDWVFWPSSGTVRNSQTGQCLQVQGGVLDSVNSVSCGSALSWRTWPAWDSVSQPAS